MVKTQADARQERLAAALRDNLKRRKDAARARSSDDAAKEGQHEGEGERVSPSQATRKSG